MLDGIGVHAIVPTAEDVHSYKEGADEPTRHKYRTGRGVPARRSVVMMLDTSA